METAPVPRSLTDLAKAEALCTRCPLFQFATQVVPGEGNTSAELMLIGEQPGNDEDVAGRPFVGPAGRVLDRALADAGLERDRTFVTNAVKHFKFEQRGKRRLHKRPNAYEIDRCRWWNEQERALVKPKLLVALGATALRSVMSKTVTIAPIRGKIVTGPDGARLLATIHPSALLRIPGSAERRAAYARFVADLRAARQFLEKDAG